MKLKHPIVLTRRRLFRKQSKFQRLLMPISTLFGGLAVYFLLFGILVDPLAPAVGPGEYRFLWEEAEGPAAGLAADMNARYAQAVPSVLMSLAAVGALIAGFAVILPRYGPGAMICGAIGIIAGGLLGHAEQHNNPIRHLVADCHPSDRSLSCPLDQAALRSGDRGSFNQDALEQIQLLTDWNSAISVACIVFLSVCFLFIARSANRSELDPKQLQRRRVELVTVLPFAGVILVLSVATTHGFYHLSSALMVPESAGPVSDLASAGTTYWGAAYSTVLIVIATPAVASLFRDIRRGAELALPKGTHLERENWRRANGLSLQLRDSVGVCLTMLTPVLTGPALDALGSLAPQ